MKNFSIDLGNNTRIYYGGDMANDEGFGVIIATQRSDFGVTVKIKMDDGRKFNISPAAFSPEYKGNGLTKFVTEKAYRDWKKAQIQKLIERIKTI